MKRTLFFLLILASSVFAQQITKVIPGYVLINTVIGQRGDRYSVYRYTDGNDFQVGLVEIMKHRQGQTAAKIIKQVGGYSIRVNDYVNTGYQDDQFSDLFNDASTFQDNTRPAAIPKNLFGVGGGIALPQGNGSELLNMGYNVGMCVLYSTNPKYTAGVKLSYSRFSPNTDELVGLYGALGGPNLNWDVTGSFSVIEISPLIRIPITQQPNVNPKIYVQLGAGYYMMKFNVTVSGTFMGQSTSFDEDYSESKFGLSGGIPLRISGGGKMVFELVPQYHMIFTENESTQMITVGGFILF